MSVVGASPPLSHDGQVRSSTTSRPSIDFPALQSLDQHPLLAEANFDSDGFLQTRSHVPLDELRGELRAYLSVLREDLVQLINEDYEEFIALGGGLRGEAERLERLRAPLAEVHEEIQTVNDDLLTHEGKLETALDHRSALREEANMLDSMHKLYETLRRVEHLLAGSKPSSRDLSRLGSEYSQISYLRKKLEAEGCAVIEAIEPRLAAIRKQVKQELAEVLVDAIRQQSSKEIRQCLKVYDIIQGWPEAQAVISVLILELAERLIRPSALTASTISIAPETPLTDVARPDKLEESSPLASLYNRVLVETQDFGLLASLAEQISPSFAFVDEVLFPDVLRVIRQNLGSSLFLAGRPDDLHSNYTTTSHFLTAMESLAPSAACVESIRGSFAVVDFRRHWQLPVYFQLRWKDIVNKLERSIEHPPATSEFAFPQTASVYAALESCWSTSVFIDVLADRFWRLSLQIISRYRVWVRQQVSVSDRSSDILNDDTALRDNARAAVDLDRLSSRAQSLFLAHGIEYPVSTLLPGTSYVDRIAEVVAARCVEQLKPIRAVASQLRTTTTRPGQHVSSPYIQTVFRPLKTVLADHPDLSPSAAARIARHVSGQVFAQSATLLLSVRKTEDLLRRHRKGKKTGFSLFGSGGQEDAASDIAEEERRFDAQMKTDVGDLRRQATAQGVQVEQLAEWRELEEVAERALERAGE